MLTGATDELNMGSCEKSFNQPRNDHPPSPHHSDLTKDSLAQGLSPWINTNCTNQARLFLFVRSENRRYLQLKKKQQQTELTSSSVAAASVSQISLGPCGSLVPTVMNFNGPKWTNKMDSSSLLDVIFIIPKGLREDISVLVLILNFRPVSFTI